VPALCVRLQAKLLSRLKDAANGLAYLHKQGVVHGDLKAANVLLQHSPDGQVSHNSSGMFLSRPAFTVAPWGSVSTLHHSAAYPPLPVCTEHIR
jgi:serine/threonine protein kinase